MAEASLLPYFLVFTTFLGLAIITFILRKRQSGVTPKNRPDRLDVMYAILIMLLVTTVILLNTEKTKEFWTISRIPINQTSPAYLVFHWVTTDALIAGNPVQVSVEARNLSLSPDDPWEDIEIRFDGVWYSTHPVKSITDFVDRDRFNFDSVNWNDGVFSTKPKTLIYSTGGSWGVWYCDKKGLTCVEIPNVIQVSPHENAIQLQTARTNNLLVTMAVIIALGTLAVARRQRANNN